MLQPFPVTVIGLDLSDHSIEAVSLRRVFGRTMLRAYGRVTIPPGVVEDGRIHDVAAAADAIRRCLAHAKPQPIQARLCVVTLPESRVFIRRLQVPAVLTPPQVRASVLNEVERALPISLADSYYDYAVVATSGSSRQVVFAATEKALVHAYVETLRRAGLTPIAFDLESASQYRALVHRPLLGVAPAVAIVDAGARTTNVSVFAGGALLGSLTIPIAGNHLTRALVEELHLQPAEAESAKRQAGILTTTTANRIGPVLLRTLQPLVAELKRYLAYWEANQHLTVTKLVLAGGSAHLPGFSEYLRQQTGLAVELPNPFSRVLTPRHLVAGRNTVLYADVIGAGLRALATHPERAGLNLLSMAKDRAHQDRRAHFLRLPARDPKLIALVATLVAGGVILGALVLARSRAVPRPAPPATSAESLVQRPVVIDWGAVATTTEGVVAGRLLRVSLLISATATATGEQSAGVIVTVVNETGADQPLVTSTRLRAPDGRIWRLRDSVTVGARDDAAVTLDAQATDDPPVGRLTLPGLSAAQQAKIYGRVTPAASTLTLSPNDLTQAATAAAALQHEAVLAALRERAGPQEWVVPAVIGRDVSAVKAERNPDGESSTFTLVGPVTFLGVAVERPALAKAMSLDPVVARRIAYDDVSFTLSGVDLDAQRVRGILTAPLPVENLASPGSP